MTAIAYRDGVMAADSEVIYNEVDIKVQAPDKAFKFRGHLIGISGESCPQNKDFREWYFDPDGPLVPPSGYSFNVMVVRPDGVIEVWDHKGNSRVVQEDFWALGAGAHVCLGAMEAGATARQAVAAAVKWAPSCGGRVITRKL